MNRSLQQPSHGFLFGLTTLLLLISSIFPPFIFTYYIVFLAKNHRSKWGWVQLFFLGMILDIQIRDRFGLTGCELALLFLLVHYVQRYFRQTPLFSILCPIFLAFCWLGLDYLCSHLFSTLFLFNYSGRVPFILSPAIYSLLGAFFYFFSLGIGFLFFHFPFFKYRVNKKRR